MIVGLFIFRLKYGEACTVAKRIVLFIDILAKNFQINTIHILINYELKNYLYI